MRNFSSRLLTVAPFFFSSVICTAVITSFTNLSLPLDDSDLECPLPSRELRLPSQCKYNEDGSGHITSCGPMDGFTGSVIINENATHRVWNLTLGPGQSTGMHRHDYDYHFIVTSEAQHAIYGPDGNYITDFWSSGEIGFIINGDNLEPTVDFMVIPRVHAAKNIGNTTYSGILYEFKASTNGQCDASPDSSAPLNAVFTIVSFIAWGFLILIG